MIESPDTVNTTIIRSERYSSKYLNIGKFETLSKVLEDTKRLKNDYSQFLFEHIYDVFIDRSYITLSNKFWKEISSKYKSNYLKGWNCQSIFQDITIQYITRIKAILHNLDLSLSTIDKNGNTKLTITYIRKMFIKMVKSFIIKETLKNLNNQRSILLYQSSLSTAYIVE